jgi:hypothetical protein
MGILSKVFWFIWGLPQNLIGAALYLFTPTIKKYKFNGMWVKHIKNNGAGAISLGMFILVYADFGADTERMLKHEFGHTTQSKILGPFYLFVIGLPSIIWAGLFRKYREKNKISYYSLYTEK